MAGRNGKGKPQGKWHWNAGGTGMLVSSLPQGVSTIMLLAPALISSPVKKKQKKTKQNLKKKKRTKPFNRFCEGVFV